MHFNWNLSKISKPLYIKAVETTSELQAELQPGRDGTEEGLLKSGTTLCMESMAERWFLSLLLRIATGLRGENLKLSKAASSEIKQHCWKLSEYPEQRNTKSKVLIKIAGFLRWNPHSSLAALLCHQDTKDQRPPMGASVTFNASKSLAHWKICSCGATCAPGVVHGQFQPIQPRDPILRSVGHSFQQVPLQFVDLSSDLACPEGANP